MQETLKNFVNYCDLHVSYTNLFEQRYYFPNNSSCLGKQWQSPLELDWPLAFV